MLPSHPGRFPDKPGKDMAPPENRCPQKCEAVGAGGVDGFYERGV
jgi:hypothetical protein